MSPLLLAAALAVTTGDGPVLDRTGIAWKHPFPTALQAAKSKHRLLAIKPIAFGTNAAGCW